MIDWMIPLLTASLCGAILGLEREWHRKPAGLRTNTLICIGSALFTIISMRLSGDAGDKTRVAAQIVTGIGFLGAGTIMRRSEDFVAGLTTAATVWTVAAIGMFAGSGHVFIALFATLFTLAVLIALRRAEHLLNQSDAVHELEIHLDSETTGRKELIAFNVGILNTDTDIIYLDAVPEVMEVPRLRLIYAARGGTHRRVLQQLRRMPGVLEVKELQEVPDYKT
jgi:putative Mg2+ transporter-C (MgtC) family protein